MYVEEKTKEIREILFYLFVTTDIFNFLNKKDENKRKKFVYSFQGHRGASKTAHLLTHHIH